MGEQTITGVLPVELYIMVVQHVTGKSDFCSLARCSSIFQVLAEPYIYHSISSRYYLKFIKAARSILSYPRRHGLVRILDLSRPGDRLRDGFHCSSIPRLVARLLLVTSNLQALRVHAFPQSRWFLEPCNHPLLNTLSVNIPRPTEREEDENKVGMYSLQYVERHPDIKHFIFHSAWSISSLLPDSTNILPNIDKLYVSGNDPQRLLKNRHLQTVWVQVRPNGWSLLEPALPCLGAMGSTLLALDLSKSWLQPITGPMSQGMQSLMKNLPRLRYLALPMTGIDQRDQDEVVHILRSCPQTLEIFMLNYEDLVPSIPEVPLKFFDILKSLKWIIFMSYYESNSDGVYTKEHPSGGCTNKSELRRVLWDLGIGLEPWENGMQDFEGVLAE
ncbi:hypothetical protein FRC02_001332 [Tulasnella sp. 418]|nr:hypothetical protein FRC02_001332 [Tulasnella sp. 418]